MTEKYFSMTEERCLINLCKKGTNRCCTDCLSLWMSYFFCFFFLTGLLTVLKCSVYKSSSYGCINFPKLMLESGQEEVRGLCDQKCE